MPTESALPISPDTGVTDVEIERGAAERLLRAGMYSLNPVRWERARTEIPFEDVVSELHGTSSDLISCPFHGRDSTPSFHIYHGTNDGHCYGCREGHRNYDTIRFAAEKMGVSRLEALRWLEKHFHLPPMVDVLAEEEEADGPESIALDFKDITGRYVRFARDNVSSTRDAELFEDYAQNFFRAADSGEETTDDEGRKSHVGDPIPLLRYLGPAIARTELARKVSKHG